jgi:hypothetical protein
MGKKDLIYYLKNLRKLYLEHIQRNLVKRSLRMKSYFRDPMFVDHYFTLALRLKFNILSNKIK